MAIPSVIQGLIEADGGKVFELDSPKGLTWLESIGSFRFEPSADNKPYTVRKESGKGGDYWYGYRKQSGKLHKKYIGKSSELNTAKLEEIAEALNTPSQSRVTDKVTEVTEVTGRTNQGVTDSCDGDRLTALELQVQTLQESLEALRRELPGKLESSDSFELPNPDIKVTDSGLQIELGNLQAEREEIAQIKKELKDAVAELHREQRSTDLEKARWQQELSDARCELADAKATMLKQSDKIRELERGYSLKPNPAESRLRLEIGELNQQLADLKQKSAIAGKDFPDVADLLNQLRAKRKKSKTDSADIAAILEILEG
ncbi:hypothetical protein QUA43_30870 [Microcoleus sp. N9_B4]|uniref:hypothetical protein n=1 Tax=Microcoleus sp. N9_B4 TaxID=3055386 RepID=UPI002FD3FC7F